MKLNIIADENISFKIIKSLRDNAFKVKSTSENYPGISDVEVLELCIKDRAILLTEDSDFGEWIFAHHKENNGVIFLRYKYPQLNELISTLIHILNKYNINLYNHFTVISANKIRMRKL